MDKYLPIDFDDWHKEKEKSSDNWQIAIEFWSPFYIKQAAIFGPIASGK